MAQVSKMDFERVVQGLRIHTLVFHANAQARHCLSGATARLVYPNQWTGTRPVEFTAPQHHMSCIWTWFLIFSLARDPRVITDGGTDDYTRITRACWRLCSVMCTLTAKMEHKRLRCRDKVRPVKTQMTPSRLPTNCGTFTI